LVHAWRYDFHLSWNYPSWSLSSEWFAYLVFPLVAVFLARVGRRSAASLVVISCGLSMAVFAFEKSLAFRGIAVVIPTFVGGVGLSVVCPPRSSRWGRRAAELGLVMAVLFPFVIGPGPILSAAYLALCFVLVAALGLAGDQSSRLLKSRPFAYLGEISYSLYMTHVCSAIIIFHFLPLNGLSGLHLGLRVFALFGILSIIALASLAMYYTVERPLRNLSRQMGSTSTGRVNRGHPNLAVQLAPCVVTGSGERMEAIS
jgi:peptidoglycan/LPS O-acetylase OafA/YrhL